MDAIKNFAKAIVFDGNYDASSTEIDVVAGHGARLPAAPFNAVWWNITDYPDPSDDPDKEIIRVTVVATDTLTITRAQEGTSANDKNTAGKTFALIAGMTARTITEMVGNIFTAINPYIAVDIPNDGIEIVSESVNIGDVQGAGNSTTLSIDDSTNMIFHVGKLSTDQIADATVAVGTLAGKIPIYDFVGELVGYIPVYNSIT
jgi:hypothetical protein